MKKILICNLRYFRLKKGYSQDKLSEICGISQNTISQVECGHYNVSIENAFRLSDALGISVTDLYTYGVSD